MRCGPGATVAGSVDNLACTSCYHNVVTGHLGTAAQVAQYFGSVFGERITPGDTCILCIWGATHQAETKLLQVRESVRSGVKDIIKRVGVTAVLVTHDQEEAFDIADRVVVFNRSAFGHCGCKFNHHILLSVCRDS